MCNSVYVDGYDLVTSRLDFKVCQHHQQYLLPLTFF